jgi:hypothetical protein
MLSDLSIVKCVVYMDRGSTHPDLRNRRSSLARFQTNVRIPEINAHFYERK